MIDQKLFIGLDIGGTKIMAASANAQGKIELRMRRDTPRALETGLVMLQKLVSELAGDRKISGIGAAIGGPLDWRTGVVSPLHQPEWREVPLKKILSEKFSCPVHLDVDTNVAALGEYFFGGHHVDKLFYMTISTGVGGGFLENGKIYRGANDGHPEVGHHGIPFLGKYADKIRCNCGAPDCLEALISGSAIRRIYGKPGEALASEEWGEVSFHLGLGLRNIASFYTPDEIVLGGGVAIGGGEAFIDNAVKAMQGRLNVVRAPKVRLSRLGYDTALMGAVAAAKFGLE